MQAFILSLLLMLPKSWLVKMSGGKPLQIGTRTLDPVMQFFAHQGASQPPMSSLTPEEAREGANTAFRSMAPKPLASVRRESFELELSGRKLPARKYFPQNQNPKAPLLVYFHMGGGVIGELDTCDFLCQLIAEKTSSPVLNVEYRKAPENKYPAAVNDAIEAYEWALSHSKEFGAPEGEAAVGGDSMGGYLSAYLSLKMRDQDKPLPTYQLLIYPAVDIASDTPSMTEYGDCYPLTKDTMDWFMAQYLPEGTDASQQDLNPLKAESLEGLPPAIIVTAGFDPLVDQGALYAERLKAEGVYTDYHCYDSIFHGFTAFTKVSDAARDACDDICSRLNRLLKKLGRS